jgi:hypothetical protein
MSDTDPSGNYTSAWVDYFQPGQGTTDAQNAISGATSAGQLTGAIYFAIDLDPAKSTDPTTGLNRICEATALNQIDEYLREISALDGRNVDLDQTSGGPFGQWGIAAQACSDRIEQIHRESAEQFKIQP